MRDSLDDLELDLGRLPDTRGTESQQSATSPAGQFWRHAAKVKGVSREFALCWNCGGDVAKNARACLACKRLQEPPLNPDILLESAEFSGDELAEAMWSDQPPTSSQMGGPSP